MIAVFCEQGHTAAETDSDDVIVIARIWARLADESSFKRSFPDEQRTSVARFHNDRCDRMRGIEHNSASCVVRAGVLTPLSCGLCPISVKICQIAHQAHNWCRLTLLLVDNVETKGKITGKHLISC